MPSASTARRATSPPRRRATDGQTWASGTPNASPSGREAIGHRERDELAARGEAADRHLRPVDDTPRRGRRRCAEAARAASIAGSSRPALRTSERPARAVRSAALTTAGSGGSKASSCVATCQRGCGTPASASASRWRSLFVARTAVADEIGCGQPELLGDPRGDGDGRIGARRDDPVESAAPRRAARGPARRRSRRCSAGLRGRSREPRGRGRRPPSRCRGSVPPRAALAAPGPPRGRGASGSGRADRRPPAHCRRGTGWREPAGARCPR